jgi:DNA excision repair protein ERCC-4
VDVKQQAQKYKNPSKSGNQGAASKGSAEDSPATSIQAKLVLLTLTFPRLRIIWSSSSYASAEIFRELKLNQYEPDPKKALLVGADEDPDARKEEGSSEGVNMAAEDLLRTLPGITAKNARYVMRRVNSLKELCEMSLADVQELLGNEPGKACYDFLHRRK